MCLSISTIHRSESTADLVSFIVSVEMNVASGDIDYNGDVILHTLVHAPFQVVLQV